MALHFTNADFINAQNSAAELERALGQAGQQTKKRRGVREDATGTPDAASKKLENDLMEILQSPLAQTQAAGYGDLPLEAIQPLRQVHKAANEFLQASEDDQRVMMDRGSLEILEPLKALVKSVDPDHPFLKQFAAQEENKGDEHPPPGQGASGEGKASVTEQENGATQESENQAGEAQCEKRKGK